MSDIYIFQTLNMTNKVKLDHLSLSQAALAGSTLLGPCPLLDSCQSLGAHRQGTTGYAHGCQWRSSHYISKESSC